MSIYDLLIAVLALGVGFAGGVVVGIKDCKRTFDIPKGATSDNYVCVHIDNLPKREV